MYNFGGSNAIFLIFFLMSRHSYTSTDYIRERFRRVMYKLIILLRTRDAPYTGFCARKNIMSAAIFAGPELFWTAFLRSSVMRVRWCLSLRIFISKIWRAVSHLTFNRILFFNFLRIYINLITIRTDSIYFNKTIDVWHDSHLIYLGEKSFAETIEFS